MNGTEEISKERQEYDLLMAGICPGCKVRIDEHATTESDLKNVVTNCALTAREVPIWFQPRR